MNTDQILDPGETCYECSNPFNADEWAFHHDQHPDWCVVEHGASCDCNESFPVHERCCVTCNGSLFEDPHPEERGHRFFPRQSVLDEIPSLYETEKQPIGERTVHLHYFTAAADFWIVELDQSSGTAFGYVCLGDPAMAEWGVIYLPELQDLYVPFKLGPGTTTPPLIVERDLYWTPKPARDCKLPGRGVSL
jgi:hypothetical protein